MFKQIAQYFGLKKNFLQGLTETQNRTWKAPRAQGICSPQFPPVLFSCLPFLNSADSTISEPGIG